MVSARRGSCPTVAPAPASGRRVAASSSAPGTSTPSGSRSTTRWLRFRSSTSATRYGASIVGILDYNFGNFELLPTATPAGVDNHLTREVTAPIAHPDVISIGTFNVENLDPNDDPSKFQELASLIVQNLRSPDVLSLEEIQDNNGPTNDGTVDATDTLNELIAAIQSEGGPAYDFRQINPVNNADGGEPGGNIRVGFLFRTDRGVAFVDRPGGGRDDGDNGRRRAEWTAAVRKPRSDRSDKPCLQQQPQAAGRRVHVQRPPLLRHHEPLQLEGRRPAAVRQVPAADAHDRGPAPRSRRRSSTTSSMTSWPSIPRPRSSC